MHRLACCVAVCLAASHCIAAEGPAAESEAKSWTVAARSIEMPLFRHRLMPAEYELKRGNAAPILLRLPWEQLPFFTEIVPKFSEHMEIPLTDMDKIRQVGAGLSERMYGELRRAACRRTADWEYPIDEQPQATILLPDIQGSRNIVGRGLSVWIRFHIATGQLDAAREGILVGLANARHYARTPFIINQLVAAANSNLMLDRVEELLQQPDSPNLYWPLAALPAPFIDQSRALEFEHHVLLRSVEGLERLEESRTPEEWRKLAEQVQRFIAENGNKQNKNPLAALVQQTQLLAEARRDLPILDPATKEKLGGMSDGEVLVRWIVCRNGDFWDRIAASSALSPPLAIRRLRAIETELAAANDLTGMLVFDTPLGHYLGLTRFERRVAALSVVEAVRHYAAGHDGRAPQNLDELTETPAPDDPFTGKPFEYKANAEGFHVSAPGIGAQGQLKHAIDLHVKLKKP